MKSSKKLLLIFVLFLAGILALRSLAIGQEEYEFVWKIPAQQWYFGPDGVAVDSSGNVYVADAADGLHRIQKFAPDGTFITKWGSEGYGDGQFLSPGGIAVDSSGNVYVVDRGNQRIQKFTSDGTFILKWGSEGTGDGQFWNPADVAVDSEENVYVVEWSNHRIQKFAPDGTFILKWGSKGSGDSQFQYPEGIAVDSEKNVYVADRSNHRIQKFAPDGEFIRKWGNSGDDDGQFLFPAGIAVDSEGNVYVADEGNHRIQKFAPDGEFIKKWGSYGSGDGQFSCPHGIAIDSEGNVYVTENSRIQKFTSDGGFILKWGSWGDDGGQFQHPYDIAVDPSGNVYVTEGCSWILNSRIQKFTPDGTFITKWGTWGDDDDQFRFPRGIAVDSEGNVYVADRLNHRIQKFCPVIANQPPEARCKDVIVDADENCQANASIDDGSSDPDPGDTIILTQEPPGPYELGETSVTLTITDSYGITNTCTATVTVVDTTPPVITSPQEVTVEQTTLGGTPLADIDLGQPVVSDVCDAAPKITNDAPAVSPLGETIVTWTVTDASGNSSTCTQIVTVVDTTPPNITINTPADGTEYIAKCHESMTIDFAVSDICDAEPVILSATLCKVSPASRHDGCREAIDCVEVQNGQVISLGCGHHGQLTLSVGTYTLTVKAIDDSSNVGESISTFNVVKECR